MTNQSTTEPDWHFSTRSWTHKLASTPAKCHALGGLLSFALIVFNFWTWTQPNLFLSNNDHTQDSISESLKLVASKRQLKTNLEDANQQSNRNEKRIEEIRSWLPEQRRWSEVRSSLEALCDETELQFLGLDQGSEHRGVRLAVVEGDCEVQGRYTDICRFVERLHALQSPIWCSAIRIRQSDNWKGRAMRLNDERDVLCDANLSIRVPALGKGTTAEKLLLNRKSTT